MKYLHFFTASLIMLHLQVDADSAVYSERYRPQYHFSAEQGWVGDPSGLIAKDGRFHLFYWGHAVSEDLIHWQQLPRALSDGREKAAFTGTVVVDKHNVSQLGTDKNPPWLAFYTGHHYQSGIQTQDLAYSLDDGTTWQKYHANPILDIGAKDFRDPQIFYHEQSDAWIMLVSLAADHKVLFYRSDNLLDWKKTGEFGPMGVTDGVWECPDLFPLEVTGTGEQKWVLALSVQPTGGIYFVGDFDGSTFSADPQFDNQNEDTNFLTGTVFEDFEGRDYTGWTATGDAFADTPVAGTLPGQSQVTGYHGQQLVNTFRRKDASTGTLTSDTFTIHSDNINFLIAGGAKPDTLGVRLLIDDEVVATATGRNTEILVPAGFDVTAYKGKSARLQIFDEDTGGFGHINVDQIVFSDITVPDYQREPYYWVDYGSDFFALKSWHNMPQQDDRKIWTAWMNNWQYAANLPTGIWQGMLALPREVTLHQNAAKQYFIRQSPVQEVKQLRKRALSAPPMSLNDEQVSLAAQEIAGSQIELSVSLQIDTAARAGVIVRGSKDGAQQTRIGYDQTTNEVYVDRRHAGVAEFHETFARIDRAPLQPTGDTVEFRIFVDESSVEVFVEDGRIVLSNLIFPDPQSQAIYLFAEDGLATFGTLRAWPLSSIWH